MEVSAVSLQDQNLREILALLNLPASQFHMIRKELKWLIWNIYYIQLTVPGVVDHLYHLQCMLTQGLDISRLSPVAWGLAWDC